MDPIKSFDDPRLDDEIAPFYRPGGPVSEIVRFLNEEGRRDLRGRWGKPYVAKRQSIHLPMETGGFGVGIEIHAQTDAREWWTVTIDVSCGSDEVLVFVKRPGYSSRQERVGYGLKKADLGNPARLFRDAGLIPEPAPVSRRRGRR